MPLDPQNTMIDPNILTYSADRTEIVASLKFLGFQISKIIQDIETIKEEIRVLYWRSDYPNGE